MYLLKIARDAFQTSRSNTYPGLPPQIKSSNPVGFGGVIGNLTGLDGLRSAFEDNVFSAVERPGRDGKKTTAGKPCIPLPTSPLSLDQYINLHGPSVPWTKYQNDVEKQINAHPLDRYKYRLTDEHFIGRGTAKDCYEFGKNTVLLVRERAGTSIKAEAISLKLLEEAGFLVARIDQLGKMPRRYVNGAGIRYRVEAMVQERLEGFFNFERVTPKMRAEFLDSPRLNENTLPSLEYLRDLLDYHGVTIGDLQGGLRKDGSFVIADPTFLSAARGSGQSRAQDARDNLDKLISEVRNKMKGRRRAPPQLNRSEYSAGPPSTRLTPHR